MALGFLVAERREVAFVSRKSLYVMNADGGGRRKLVDHVGHDIFPVLVAGQTEVRLRE